MNPPLEKLGSFYLGSEYDILDDKSLDRPLNYDARDLTTHAVCFGMTGSGKTGLCIGILEEAALDKVPAIIIDPKGDISNLLLQFPELRPSDFRPWVNPDDARRKDMSLDDFSEYISETWENGLREWGIGKERIQELSRSVEFSIYTPGSDAGLQVSILKGFSAPKKDQYGDDEAIRERITGTVSALMELIGIRSDPIRGKEAILLSSIFDHYWKAGEDLDIAKLIMSIQDPPFDKMGVFDLDTFYPKNERFELAMALNVLLASHNFKVWMEGEELDIEKVLYTREGKPRHSVFYLAHLSEKERMFFVTLLLENLLGWTRKQSGTTSLRALLYFDETLGFMPPVAEPPSKRPLMTLLKQARAFGLGILLVTQNPVDIDYKGLTNAGTWFIGKLQAERDKEKVIQGLKGLQSSGSLEADIDYDKVINRLGNRLFLMHNVHESGPKLFKTRWAMSYLRGPLTKPQVKELMGGNGRTESEWSRMTELRNSEAHSLHERGFSRFPPSLGSGIEQYYLPTSLGRSAAAERVRNEVGSDADLEDAAIFYDPLLLGWAKIHYEDNKRRISENSEVFMAIAPPDGLEGIEWGSAKYLENGIDELGDAPMTPDTEGQASYSEVPDAVKAKKDLSNMEKDLANWLYQNKRLSLDHHPGLGIFRMPEEPEREFIARLRQAAREKRDAEIDQLEGKYEKKLDKLKDKLEKLELKLESDQEEYDARKREEMLGAGESALSFFIGRRRTSSISTMARKRRLTEKAKHDIKETSEDIENVKEQAGKLEAELKAAVDDITSRWDRSVDDIEKDEIRPRRSDVDVRSIALLWNPVWLFRARTKGTIREIEIPAYEWKRSSVD